jgi:hypothetical protein
MAGILSNSRQAFKRRELQSQDLFPYPQETAFLKSTAVANAGEKPMWPIQPE